MTNTLASYNIELDSVKVRNPLAYYNTELERIKVTYIDKYSSLLSTEKNKLVKSFITQAQGGSINQGYFFYKLKIIKNVNKSTTTKAWE